MREIYNEISANEKPEVRSFRPAARRRKQSIVSASAIAMPERCIRREISGL
jgi:hypothetical protein